jgi:hypothetical protein
MELTGPPDKFLNSNVTLTVTLPKAPPVWLTPEETALGVQFPDAEVTFWVSLMLRSTSFVDVVIEVVAHTGFIKLEYSTTCPDGVTSANPHRSNE